MSDGITDAERDGKQTSNYIKKCVVEQVKQLPITYAFTVKAETQGRSAKIHLLGTNKKARCNPHLDIDQKSIYEGKLSDLMYNDVLVDPICKTCYKREFHQ